MCADKISGNAPKIQDPRKLAPSAPENTAAKPKPVLDRFKLTSSAAGLKTTAKDYQGSRNADFLANPAFASRLEEATAQAKAIAATQVKATSGNIVSRGFNSFTNLFSGNMSQMENAAKNAVRLYQTELPRDLAHYHELNGAAGDDPAKIKAANDFLDGALAKAKTAGQQFDKAAKAFGAGNKFWAGLTADVGSGLLVLGGVALCITGFGAPIGAGMIAGGLVAGGAMNVGAHALLDNQYDFKREALANFAIGGISAGATVLTGGLGTGAAASLTRMAIQQGTIGSFTGMAGSLASEGSQGWQAGWAGRVTRSTMIGGTVGTLLGAGSGAVAQKFISPTLSAGAAQAARTGLGSTSGAAGASLGGVINEGVDGFREGWQGRVLRQGLGGALSGAAYSLGPNLALRNQQVLRKGQIAKPVIPPTEPTATRDRTGEIPKHLIAEIKTAIGAPPGSRLEKLIDQQLNSGQLYAMREGHREVRAAVQAGLLNERQAWALVCRVNDCRQVYANDALVKIYQQAARRGAPGEPGQADVDAVRYYHSLTAADAGNLLKGLGAQELIQTGVLLGQKGYTLQANYAFNRAFDLCLSGTCQEIQNLKAAVPLLPDHAHLHMLLQSAIDSFARQPAPIAKTPEPGIK